MPILYKLNNTGVISAVFAIFLMVQLGLSLVVTIPPLTTISYAVMGGAAIFASAYLLVRYSLAWSFLLPLTMVASIIVVPDLLLAEADRKLYVNISMLSLLFLLWAFRKPMTRARYFNPDFAGLVAKDLARPYSKWQQHAIDHLSSEQLAKIDQILLQQITIEWRPVREVVGNTLAELNLTFSSVPCSLLLNRLRMLAEAKQLLLHNEQDATAELMCCLDTQR